jgi:membrane-bound lytic murein transglycosylase B
MGGNDSPQSRGQSFKHFLIGLEAEAKSKGLPYQVLRASYGTTKPAPLPKARKAETKQAEFTGTLEAYLNRAVSPARVARGKALLAEHRRTLKKLEKTYGVPPELMMALWGIESDYGRNTGTMPLIPTLTSMAYKSPRHALFRREVFAALQLDNSVNLKGSWAGATGQCQFLPSNVLAHARDGNADGTIDIWRNEADTFASSANFIRHLGYTPNQPWRWHVQGTIDMQGIALNARGLSEPMPLAAWQARGLKTAVKLPSPTPLRLYQPMANGDYYMVGPNYEAVLAWNYSSFFATSVFTLAAKIDQKIGEK